MKKYINYIIIFASAIMLSYSIYYGMNFNDSPFEQMYYSLIFSSGTGIESILDIILIITILSFVIFFLVMVFLKLRKKIKYLNFKSEFIFSICFFFFSLIVILSRLNLLSYLYNQIDKSLFYEENYVSPNDVEINFEGEKRNLIYIFLESFEGGLISYENGGFYQESIVPNLEQLALDNVSFSTTDKLNGGYSHSGNAWTMSAMLGQTAGITMNLPIGGDVYDYSESYMNNLVTLGDVLDDNGYNNYLMVGSDGDFAGRKDYFQDHGNYEVFDYYTAIEEGKIDSDYYVWWGFEDLKLFSYAKEEVLKLASSDEPFNFTMLTVDTHFSDGYMDSTCKTPFDDHYLNSFNCSDTKVYEFVSWIMEQDFYDNTTIVITGDHYSMQVIDKDMERTIYNSFINSAITPVTEKNRLFSTLDMFPTTLASIGATIEGNRLGLGTNLFSNEETLMEKYGYEYLDTELQKYSEFYKKNFLN